MTQAKFLMPYTGGSDYEDDFRNISSTLFDAIRFINLSKSSFYKGFVPFSGGQPYGQIARTHFTSVDVENAGATDINEIILTHMVSHGNLQQRAYACVRYPVSVSSQNMQAGVITVEVYRDQLRMRHWTGFSANTPIATATSARLAPVSGGLSNQRPVPFLVRVRSEGTNFKAKVWTAAEPEPASWDIDEIYTDAGVNSTGIPAVHFDANGTFTGLIGHVSFASGEPALPLFGTISGNVLEYPDVPLARPIRAVSREDPMVHFEGMSAGDGTYALQVLLGHTYTVYSLDATYNAAIADRVTPVTPAI